MCVCKCVCVVMVVVDWGLGFGVLWVCGFVRMKDEDGGWLLRSGFLAGSWARLWWWILG